MKKIIRLTEGDIHHMVRRAINEVLDGMDDTEKAYWLMRQRQQRPNTKSRTNTDYVDNFRRKYYDEINSTDRNTNRDKNPRGEWELPRSWDRNTYRTGNENVDVQGGIDIDREGNFNAKQRTWGGTIKDRYTDPGMINRNFRYTQKPEDKNGQFYDNEDWNQKKDSSNVTMTPNFRNMFNKGLSRYNDLAAKYDRQRQSQQPK